MKYVYAVLIGLWIYLGTGCAPVVDECMTDACITERTGDINPADPLEDEIQYIYESRRYGL